MKKLLFLVGLVAAIAPHLIVPSKAGTRNFSKPTVGGDRLSFCSSSGDFCGKPIADAWCRAIGFEDAITYVRDQGSGDRLTVARYADTGGVCRGGGCESFRQIKCWNGAN